VSLRDREGLIARIRQTSRLAGPPASAPEVVPVSPSDADPDPARVSALEARIAHLESLLEGLQDSIHRESARQSKRITELEARTEPAALAVALSHNARNRGL
jgi:hypothetical protein